MIEDLVQKCASGDLGIGNWDLARLMLGDVIKQKDVMMGLAKGQRVVINMGERGFPNSQDQDPIFRLSPRH